MRFLQKLLTSFLLSILIFSVSASAVELSLEDFPPIPFRNVHYIISRNKNQVSSNKGDEYILTIYPLEWSILSKSSYASSTQFQPSDITKCSFYQLNDDHSSWIPFRTKTYGLNQNILYSDNPVYGTSQSTIIFKANAPMLLDTKIDTDTVTDTEAEVVESPSDFDFDNSLTAQKISKFIDTFSSLFRLLFVFFLMFLLYKFFNIFF